MHYYHKGTWILAAQAPGMVWPGFWIANKIGLTVIRTKGGRPCDCLRLIMSNLTWLAAQAAGLPPSESVSSDSTQS